MKKLLLTLSMLLIFSHKFITPAESPSIMKTLTAKFEAFKQYFFQKKEGVPQPTKI